MLHATETERHPMNQPTILDVAARAGVSKSLVSLVMQGSPRVSDESRAAVLEAAAELGYRPNAVARSLVRRRSGTVGCILADLHNPFYADVADGIEEGAVAAGYRALLSSSFLDARREAVAVDTLLRLRVDGLILLGTMNEVQDITEAVQHVPTVLIGRKTDSPGLDSVCDDDATGAEAIVAHLVELGHRRIAHIHAASAAGSRGRRDGYERAMRRHGLEDHIRLVEGAFTEAGGHAAMKEIIATEDPPTAVFVANDFAAVGALDAIDESGLAVPGDISIAGYDNVSLARIGRISLTTVDQPRAEMGEIAVRLLLERLEGGRNEARHIVVAPHLVVRSTTGPPLR